MPTTITINDTLRLDQTIGIQDDDTAIAADLTGLSSAFRTHLLGLAGDLALSADQLAYADATEAAISGAGYVTVDADGAAITDLFFSDPDGNAFDGDPVIYNGNPLQTVDGAPIYLWSQAGGDIVLATTGATPGAGDVVAAFYLNDTADNLSASIEMVSFIAIEHTDPNSVDETVDWTDLLNVSASGSTSFDFNALRSGSSLWVAVGSASGGVLVTGGHPVVNNATGKKTNASDVIHTSQGGDGTTIGVNNQLFDNAGETGVFTLVTGLDTITGPAGATGDYVVDPNTSDTKPEGIDYDGYLNVTGAGIYISQSQGSPSVSKSFDINLYSAGGGTTPEEGFGYVNGLASDAAVNVGSVTVTNDDGEVVGVWGVGGVASGTVLHSSSANGETNVTVSISGNNIDVNGVFGEFTVGWTSLNGAEFNRFTLVSEVGQFDVGRVDISQGLTITTPVGDSLFVDDDGPSVDLALNGAAELVVDESTLPAVDSITAADLFSTNTADFGTDGAGADGSAYKLLLADDNSGLFDTLSGDEVLLTSNLAGTLIIGAVGDGEVFRIALDPATGELTLTQSRAMVNGDPADPDEDDTPLTLPTGLVSIQRTLTDGDDDSASDSVDISAIFKFEDDGPSLGPATQAALALITDDTGVTDTATLSTDDIFTGPVAYGNDGPNQVDPIVYSLRVVGTDPASGLIDTATGRAILLKKVGADVVGIVDTDGNGSIGALETTVAIRYSLSVPDPSDLDTETVTFTQYRAVVHDDVNDPNEATTPETINGGLVFIDQTAIDGDGDVSDEASFDLGAVTQLLDDGPAIGPIGDGLVDFAQNDSANEDLNGVVGSDTKTSPYTLTSYTASLTVNGVDLHAVTSGDATVGYWADTNGDTIFGNSGDTEYYRLVLGDQAGEGDYTFTVLVNPPQSNTEFRFDDLPSGSNLFGIVGDADAGLIIFGQDIVLKADHTYIANQTQEVKTSQAGLHDTIGIESQMFDPGDAAYFTFVNDPDPNFTGTGLGSTEADDADNILYGSTLEGDSAFIRIAQLQGNTAPSMRIQLFNIDDSPQGVAMLAARGHNAAGTDPDITDVRVYNANNVLIESYSAPVANNGLTINIVDGVATVTGFGTNYKIEWDADEDFDQTLITGVAGKFDIGGFGFTQGNDTPDQLLEFTARVTDGDGDYAEASWKVGIDGTGIYDDNNVPGII